MSANSRVTRSRLRSSGVSVFAAALFIFAQAVGLVHDLDANNFAQDHVCAVCVAGGNLDAADVGSFEVLLLHRPSNDAVAGSQAIPLSGTRIFRPLVRGPPAAS